MNAVEGKIHFVAVLVFEDGPGRRGVEPHVFAATHPEVAYRCALARGGEERDGREFVGLAELRVATEDVAPIGRIEPGEARDLVVPKEALTAFRDPRWVGVPCDPAEVEAALLGPPVL